LLTKNILLLSIDIKCDEKSLLVISNENKDEIKILHQQFHWHFRRYKLLTKFLSMLSEGIITQQFPPLLHLPLFLLQFNSIQTLTPIFLNIWQPPSKIHPPNSLTSRQHPFISSISYQSLLHQVRKLTCFCCNTYLCSKLIYSKLIYWICSYDMYLSVLLVL